MKILLVNQFFWPDAAATSQFLTDLARHLGIAHDVTVICSAGWYTGAKTAGDAPPVKIIRVPGYRYGRSAIGRALSYTTFLAASLWHELTLPRPDVIVTMTTPPMLSIGGAILKALRGTRHYIWEMDLFPDAFVSLGALREHGWATRALRRVADFCRRNSDGIITLGPCMRNRLLAHGLPKHLVHLAENWADGSVISPQPFRSWERLNVLYSGNFGLSHDVETITAAIFHFKNDSRFVFTFAGGGVQRDRLERWCQTAGISNVRFLPYCTREQMGHHLAQAHIGLVTQRPACVGTVVPSKVYGLMASGRPILFIGSRRATPAILIRRFGCGWSVEPGATVSLIDLLETLAGHPDWICERGISARRAFERYYDLSHGVARVAAILVGRESQNSSLPRTSTSTLSKRLISTAASYL
jgi:colanic acid biosynthesis glycosyl transferase WcaI